MKNKLMILAATILIGGAALNAGESTTRKVTGVEVIDKDFCNLLTAYLNDGKKSSGVKLSKDRPLSRGMTIIRYKRKEEWRDWLANGVVTKKYRGSADTLEMLAAFEKCIQAKENPELLKRLKQDIK